MPPRSRVERPLFFDYTMKNPCKEIFLGEPEPLTFNKWGKVNRKKPLDERVWKVRDGHKIPLGKMNRGHIQAALQWCIQHKSTFENTPWTRTKDGYTYDEWIAMFLAKLLDPNTLE
jgi:hypothetical protein